MASTDRAALVALYNATDGANWRNRTNWNTDAPLGQWYRVKVNDQGRVVALKLGANNLTGCIPSELGHLSALKELYLFNNQLSGHIPRQLEDLGALETLDLSYNKLEGPIPSELGNLSALKELYLFNNQLSGAVPKELANLKYMKVLRLEHNKLERPLPPMFYGIYMRDWGGIPTEDEKLRARAATGGMHPVGNSCCLCPPLLTLPGTEQPVIVKTLDFLTNVWHVVVPVVDDVTDVLLLTSTADPASTLWWICLITLVVADIERLWLLCTLCLTMVLPPFLWIYDAIVYGCGEVDFDFVGITASRFFSPVNCRDSAPRGTFRGRLADSCLWVLVGSRSRCSPFWCMMNMSLDVKVDEADHAGVGFGAIDKWVSRHPFTFLGKNLFGARFALKGGDEGESRRAGVMIRAVGETLVVDSLFLALSVVSGGWDGNLTGVAGFSALFSVLELLTELQYYVAEAGAVLEPVSSSGTAATSGGRSEQGAASDPSTVGVAVNV